MGDAEPKVRQQAALALAEKEDVAALPELRRMLAPALQPRKPGNSCGMDCPGRTLDLAIKGLAKLGGQAKPAVPDLIQALKYDIEQNAECRIVSGNDGLVHAPDALCKIGRAPTAV